MLYTQAFALINGKFFCLHINQNATHNMTVTPTTSAYPRDVTKVTRQ